MSEWKYLPRERPYPGQQVVACYIAGKSPSGKVTYEYVLADYSSPNLWISPERILQDPYCWAAIVEPGL